MPLEWIFFKKITYGTGQIKSVTPHVVNYTPWKPLCRGACCYISVPHQRKKVCQPNKVNALYSASKLNRSLSYVNSYRDGCC